MRCPICLFDDPVAGRYCAKCGADLQETRTDNLHDLATGSNGAAAPRRSLPLPAKPTPRPLGVILLAVAAFLFATLEVAIAGAHLLHKQQAGNQTASRLLSDSEMLVGLATVHVFIGIGLWRGHRWVWWVLGSIAAFSLFMGVLGFGAAITYHADDPEALERAVEWPAGRIALSTLMLAYAFLGKVRGFFRVDRIKAGYALLIIAGVAVVPTVVLAAINVGVSNWTRYATHGTPSQSASADAIPPYLERRAAFRTRLTRRGPAPQDWEYEVPPPDVREVRYPSGNLMLKAWVYVPRARAARKPPALVFFHGGFAFARSDLEVCQPFMRAGFVVMTPMLRGENGNPGNFELFWGEVDDARAAIRWLATQPYVDADHIYAFGHSAGGGVSALLSLQENVPLRHSGSAGGLYPPEVFSNWHRFVPFDSSVRQECELRVLMGNARDMRLPHYAYVGKADPLSSIPRAVRDEAARPGSKLTISFVPGGHAASLEPALRQYLALIQDQRSEGH